MRKFNFLLISAFAVTTVFTGCKKDKDEEATPAVQEAASLRTKVDYSKLTATTAYNNELFVDSEGDSTVDRSAGQNLYLMFRGLNSYNSSGTTTVLDASKIKGMFANTGYSFTGVFAPLNYSDVNIRSNVASSYSSFDANSVRSDIESFMDSLAKASSSNTQTADIGKAGLIFKKGSTTSKYLVNAKGIEYAQVIQKGLIGAFQIDYIGNVLLHQGLNADNTFLVLGKNYTKAEQNWDLAYGVLTVKPRYAQDATETSNGGESFIGSYMWEYNKTGYPKIHGAFLKGRAAIVNNDKATLKTQSDLIRNEMEIAIANAALGYLGKWKTYTDDTDPGSAVHAIGEGSGFIYALRFCKMHGADAAFSNKVLNDLLYSSPNGFWDLTNDKINAASDAIRAKFNIQ